MKDAATSGFTCLDGVGLPGALQRLVPLRPQFTGTYDVQNVRPQPEDNVRVPDPPKAGEIPLPHDFRPQMKLKMPLPEYQGWQAHNVFIFFTGAPGLQRRQEVWLIADPAAKGNN